jgi:hypothetical protein
VPGTCSCGSSRRVAALRRAVPSLYAPSLRRAIDEVLPVDVVPAQWGRKERRWRDRQVVLVALLIGWDEGQTAAERFESAREAVAAMYPGRGRPGTSYNGFMNALGRYSDHSLAELQGHLRRETLKRLGGEQGRHWLYKGKWVLIAADGSRFDAPDTKANEEGLGTAGRGKSGPQQFLTVLYHLTGGLPWAFARGGARASERHHLREMIPLLPEAALLVADAGFVGYDLLKALLGAGKDFLIRVGSNVRLLRKLGHAREHAGTVYLWPEGKREDEEPPLVLRLVRRVKGRGARRRCVYLLTSVTDRRVMSDGEAGRIYRLRWAVEVMYRAIKKTLGRRKVLSASPERAGLELDWAVMSMWVLGLLCAGEQLRTRAGPGAWGVARALRAVRRAVRRPDARCPGGAAGFRRLLRLAAMPDEERGRPAEEKKARHRRDKKKDRPPGKPKARKARKAEVEAAKRLWKQEAAT